MEREGEIERKRGKKIEINGNKGGYYIYRRMVGYSTLTYSS